MNVSVITVGTWAIGADGWGEVDRKDSISAIHAMLDNGVNFIDTAPAYGYGHSEEVVGEAIKGKDRTKLYIATKFGSTWPNGPGNGMARDNSRKNIFREVEDSLRRIGTDYLDLYICHWPDPQLKASFEETITALEDLRKEGKIRWNGVSNYTKEQMAEMSQFGAIHALQPPYSMVNRTQEEHMVWAHEHGIANMTYGSLGAGILTGAIRELPKFEKDDRRLSFYEALFTEPGFSNIQALLKIMDGIAEQHGVPVAQVAVNWITQSPIVDTALMGVRNVAEAEENCAGTLWALSDEEYAFLDKSVADTVGDMSYRIVR
jgi:aryl-alcohol dehydrogenase-like predicted oxidoreductase